MDNALANAIKDRDAARIAMNAAKIGSRKWRDAEEALNFWQGKVAFLGRNDAAVIGLAK